MSHERVTAIYPGSFDPVTNGHLDIIQRGANLFQKVVVAVLHNEVKAPLFDVAERVELLRLATQAFSNVSVDTFDGLLVDYANKKNATAILRGIRAVTDFDYEFQMALMNRRLQAKVETVFLVPAENYSFLSSSLVKEVCSLGGSVKGLVPDFVEKRLTDYFSEQ